VDWLLEADVSETRAVSIFRTAVLRLNQQNFIRIVTAAVTLNLADLSDVGLRISTEIQMFNL
jgi:hypothetical protein